MSKLRSQKLLDKLPPKSFYSLQVCLALGKWTPPHKLSSETCKQLQNDAAWIHVVLITSLLTQSLALFSKKTDKEWYAKELP
jgi:hypothetical protein